MERLFSNRRHRPLEDLRRYAYHTGATPTRLEDGEPCPVLFRDVGLAGMELFLSGRMRRLAGPLSPIVYARTADYREPYTDYDRIGRLVMLRPLTLQPWHSGVESIFVTSAKSPVDWSTVAFVPGHLPLSGAAGLAQGMRTAHDWRDALGGPAYHEMARETLAAIRRVQADLAATESLAGPLRRRLQSSDSDLRQRAREQMRQAGITEADLCAAWHHLPHERREVVREGLKRTSENTCENTLGNG